jgi:hypothetical protein
VLIGSILIYETPSECGSRTKRDASPPFAPSATPLHQYIEGAGLADDPKAVLFQSYSRAAGQLTSSSLPQANAYAIIQRRAKAAGITDYLANGGALEHARELAAHESPRTTKLYDRTKERLTQDEVERIRL